MGLAGLGDADYFYADSGWRPETVACSFCGEHPSFPAYIKSLEDSPR